MFEYNPQLKAKHLRRIRSTMAKSQAACGSQARNEPVFPIPAQANPHPVPLIRTLSNQVQVNQQGAANAGVMNGAGENAGNQPANNGVNGAPQEN